MLLPCGIPLYNRSMDAVSTMGHLPYRGRLAPSPTGLLHAGHACTFWTAYQRALEHNGTLIFRNEDLDPQRSKPEFATAMIEDLELARHSLAGRPRRRRSASRLTSRAGGASSISRPGASCATADSFIPAPARARIWPRRPPRRNEGDDEPMYPGRCREKIARRRRYEIPAA